MRLFEERRRIARFLVEHGGFRHSEAAVTVSLYKEPKVRSLIKSLDILEGNAESRVKEIMAKVKEQK